MHLVIGVVLDHLGSHPQRTAALRNENTPQPDQSDAETDITKGLANAPGSWCRLLGSASCRNRQPGSTRNHRATQQHGRGQRAAKTETYFALPVLVNENVERLEIAVDERRVVRVHVHQACAAQHPRNAMQRSR